MPSWVCSKQNKLIDAKFSMATWQEYIGKKILEITCGEAPYLVSRYDAVSGEKISLENRIGMLDRKLRVVGEHAEENIEEWLCWAKKAVQSIYGYEFQGDNIFLARRNIFLSVCEYFEEKFKFLPQSNFSKEIAEIISWNVWQMDGFTNAVPITSRKNQIYLNQSRRMSTVRLWIGTRINQWNFIFLRFEMTHVGDC